MGVQKSKITGKSQATKKRRIKMKTSRKIAIIVGALYLTVNFVAGPVSVVLELPILDAPDYLAIVSANETRWIIRGLLVFYLGIGVACIGLVIYPILKQHSESMAMVYAGARVIEGTLYIVGLIFALSLLTLSQEFVKAGAPDDSYFQTLGGLLLAAKDWAGHVLGFIVFGLGALMFNYLLYQSRLIPRWLSGLGFVAAILALAAALLVLFGLLETFSMIDTLLQIPLFLSEMVLGIWLIVKGFNPSAIVSEPA
jgi:hypothetical protein